jgi:hypothetical protein
MRKGWAMRRDVFAGGTGAHTLSIIIHNFMDATRLEEERINALCDCGSLLDGASGLAAGR